MLKKSKFNYSLIYGVNVTRCLCDFCRHYVNHDSCRLLDLMFDKDNDVESCGSFLYKGEVVSGEDK